MIIAAYGESWLLMDLAWFESCRGPQYCRRYYQQETLGL